MSQVEKPKMRGTAPVARLLLAAAIAAGCAGCDQATKGLAARYLQASGTFDAAGDWIQFQYVENSGALLGIGASLEPSVRYLFLVGLGPIALAVSIVRIVRGRDVTGAEAVALAFIIGGALGNLTDRVLFGFVRDFAIIGFGPLRTGIFNLADVALLAGVALMVGVRLSHRIAAGLDSR